MTHPYRRLLAAALLLSIGPGAGAAEVYKWIDEEGVTHYSQQPPPQGEEVVIETRPGSQSAPEAAGNGGDGDDTADGDEADGEQETIADFCADMRDEQGILQGDGPVRVKGEDGTLTKLDDEARAERLERIESQLEEHCQDVDGSG